MSANKKTKNSKQKQQDKEKQSVEVTPPINQERKPKFYKNKIFWIGAASGALGVSSIVIPIICSQIYQNNSVPAFTDAYVLGDNNTISIEGKEMNIMPFSIPKSLLSPLTNTNLGNGVIKVQLQQKQLKIKPDITTSSNEPILFLASNIKIKLTFKYAGRPDLLPISVVFSLEDTQKLSISLGQTITIDNLNIEAKLKINTSGIVLEQNTQMATAGKITIV